MNNQVAAPCCGSCEHCKTCIHGVRCYERTPYLIIALGNSCLEGRKHKPRNPIPIIQLPGVKELIKKLEEAEDEVLELQRIALDGK